jgi:hypothetical protein
MIGRGKAQKQAARGQRLSAALRQNLKRRKAQARGRGGESAAAEDTANAQDGARAPDFRRNPGR